MHTYIHTDSGHSFNLEEAKMVRYAYNKRKRKIIEAALISSGQTIIQRAGCFSISEHLVTAIAKRRS